MNKRGIALIFGLLVATVLFILTSSFFLKSINENNLVRRYINSMRAFWVAEAGVADAIKNFPNSGSGNLGSYNYQWTTAYRTTIGSGASAGIYYDISSTGIVPLSGGGDIRRTVSAIGKKRTLDPSKFKYGITAANDLCFGGNCNGTPENYLDPDICDGVPCWKEFDVTINFTDLFGYSQSDVEAIATHYSENNFPGSVTGVTWVDVTPNLDGTPGTLTVTGDLTGSGVLIIDGNVHFGGTYQFHGIVYVLGTLTARGTFDAYGSTIVASTAGIDTINGTPEFHYNPGDIASALNALSDYYIEIVSWKEEP